MKVQILIDNIAGHVGDAISADAGPANKCAAQGERTRKLFGEWGLSVYVEYDGHKVLLDTGASHLFAKNAKVMGIDLSQVDIGVLSHTHYALRKPGAWRCPASRCTSLRIFSGPNRPEQRTEANM